MIRMEVGVGEEWSYPTTQWPIYYREGFHEPVPYGASRMVAHAGQHSFIVVGAGWVLENIIVPLWTTKKELVRECLLLGDCPPLIAADAATDRDRPDLEWLLRQPNQRICNHWDCELFELSY